VGRVASGCSPDVRVVIAASTSVTLCLPYYEVSDTKIGESFGAFVSREFFVEMWVPIDDRIETAL
jgi:hypothetical protein